MAAAVDMIDRGFAALEGFLIVALLSFAAILNFSQVPARYLFGLSFSSAEEVSVFCMLWAVFIGMARAERLGQNISIDILHNFLSEERRRVLWRFSDFLLAVIAFFLAWHAIEAVAFSHMIGERSVSKLGAPIWVVMLVIPATFFMVGARAALRCLKGRKRDLIVHEAGLKL